MAKRFIMVVDKFYSDPDSVRRRALNMTFTKRKDFASCVTQRYYPKGVKGRIEKALKWPIKCWEDEKVESEYYNGAFFTGFAKGACAERAYIHYDTPPTWITLLIYLTPDAPVDAGTSVWQHRATRLFANPTRKDAERLKTSIAELHEMLINDVRNQKRWIEIDRVGNVYNRAVIFTSGIFHSATRHFGSDQFNGRIFQAFRFSVDWDA